MKSIAIVRDSINIEKLDEDLQAALTTNYIGLSTRFNEVIVFMDDATPSADVLQARSIVINHDPMQLTAEQQARIARQQAIDSARSSNTEALNLADYDAADILIRKLAQKIRWLELELRDLRGLN
jgi:multidrug efflux pump subunit AcrA (membrane-fusion protein)